MVSGFDLATSRHHEFSSKSLAALHWHPRRLDNRQQQEAIDYLRTENQVLKEKLSKKRILLNDDQRRRLAVQGKILGRQRLYEVGTLFTPDTILRWHRKLVADKWDCSQTPRKETGKAAIAR